MSPSFLASRLEKLQAYLSALLRVPRYDRCGSAA